MGEKELTEASEIDRICTIVPGSFSVVAAVLVGISVLLFKKLQTQSFYLVVLQNVSEMIFNLSIIAFYHPPVHGNWQCQFQGWLINYGIMSSIFFSGVIAAHMYLTIKVRGYKLTTPKLINLTIIIVILSAGIAAIPFSTHQYEDLNANCWLAEGEYDTSVTYGIVMRFATHYGLIWLTCLFCAFSYVAIVKYVQDIKQQLRNSVLTSNKGPSEMEKTIYRLQYYPAILMFVWFGITLCRVYSSIFPHKTLPIWALCTGHAILNTQGLLNGIVFFSYRTVWFSWVKLLSLESLVLRWESESHAPVRTFGRKSLTKRDRTQLNGRTPICPINGETNQQSSTSSSSTSRSNESTASYSVGGSTLGISLPTWGKGFFQSSEQKDGRGGGGEDGMGVARQVATSSSLNESESSSHQKDEQDEVATSSPTASHSIETSFSPLQSI